MHQVVREHLETFLTQAADLRDGEGLPSFVEQEFRDFLRCGSLGHHFHDQRHRAVREAALSPPAHVDDTDPRLDDSARALFDDRPGPGVVGAEQRHRVGGEVVRRHPVPQYPVTEQVGGVPRVILEHEVTAGSAKPSAKPITEPTPRKRLGGGRLEPGRRRH